MKFRDGMDSFLEDQIGNWGYSTTEERRCKLGTLATRMEMLYTKGKISTIDPKVMTVRDVQQFLQSMRDDRLATSTQKKYLQLLDQYLQFFDNYSAMKVRNKVRLTVPLKDVECLSKREAVEIMNYIDRLHGWNGSIVRGMTYLAYQTMARPSEIRLAEVRDLDLVEKRFFVRNPKGNGVFADPEWVPLLFPNSVDVLQKYLEERERYLKEHGVTSKYLFPRCYRDDVGPYTLKSMNSKIRKVSNAVGINFTMKTWRSTVATWFVEYNKELLDEVSDDLRHKTVKTTNEFYARIRKTLSGKVLTTHSPAVDVSHRRLSSNRH